MPQGVQPVQSPAKQLLRDVPGHRQSSDGAFHPVGYGSCSCPCSACCRSTDNRYTAFPYSWPTCAPAGCRSPHSRESLQTGPPFRHRSACVFRFPESAAPVQTALPEWLLHGYYITLTNVISWATSPFWNSIHTLNSHNRFSPLKHVLFFLCFTIQYRCKNQCPK